MSRTAVLALLAITECALADVSLDGRGCPCVEGWTCRDGTCVPGDGASLDGSDAAVDGSATSDGGEGADATPTVTCPPSFGGPPLVPVDTYCIDRTEVTVAQYRAFLDAGVAPQADPPRCAGNTFLVPSGENGGPPPADVPVFVDWCDAYAFCKWSGKRLCGAIGGGALDLDAGVDRNANEWLHACTGPSGSVYPYGNDIDRDACAPSPFTNIESQPYSALWSVESVPRCEGAYPGIFGMTGNGAEWVDECESDQGCVAFGLTTCRDWGIAEIWTIYNAFRCCAP